MAFSHSEHDHYAFRARLRSQPRSIDGSLVDDAYAKLSGIYDVVFGAPLQPGRKAAIQRMAIRPGDRILEVGTGTGITAPLYPRNCHVTAIDVSRPMLERARRRVTRRRLSHVKLIQQDAARMTFADDCFDSVYAPYVISVVPDPIGVAREMRRVCRPGGRIVILNHFRSANPLFSWLEEAFSPLTIRVGFRLDLSLIELLQRAQLCPASVDQVNIPPVWSLVTCIK